MRKVAVPIGRLHCKDGASLSVQANDTAYCNPRMSFADHYSEVEVGFIENATLPDTWLEYADDGTIDSDVFAYVPVALVEEFIQAHGGIDLGKTLAIICKRAPYVEIP